MKDEKLLDNYGLQLRGSEHTRRHFLAVARRFLETTNKRGREGWLEFEEKMRKKGYSDGTILTWFGIIRRLHKANDLPWDFRRGEAPVIRESDVWAPALSPDVIEEMILAAKQGLLSGQEQAFLAISTLYGTRRTEMIELAEDDIDIARGTIFIHTAKHGRERMHMLPRAIIPYIENYDFDTPISEWSLNHVYRKIEARLGIKHANWCGWHAIRRTLVTELTRKPVVVNSKGDVDLVANQMAIMKFMRWKSGGGIMSRYYATSYVGRDGQARAAMGEDIDLDRKVFSVHPFLAIWERGKRAI